MSTSDFFDSQHNSDLLPLPLHFRLLRRWEVKREDVALELLGEGERLLDIGCGDGHLAQRARYTKIVATDVSDAAIAAAREQDRSGRIDYRVLDANAKLPFADASFDTLVSLSTLQYIFDPDAFLREAHRVTRPGGRLLIEVPNLGYLPQRLRLLAGRLPRTSFWKHGIDGGNLHYFTVDSLSELVRTAGFAPRKISGSGVFAQVRVVRVSLLCGNIFLLADRL